MAHTRAFVCIVEIGETKRVLTKNHEAFAGFKTKLHQEIGGIPAVVAKTILHVPADTASIAEVEFFFTYQLEVERRARFEKEMVRFAAHIELEKKGQFEGMHGRIIVDGEGIGGSYEIGEFYFISFQAVKSCRAKIYIGLERDLHRKARMEPVLVTGRLLYRFGVVIGRGDLWTQEYSHQRFLGAAEDGVDNKEQAKTSLN